MDAELFMCRIRADRSNHISSELAGIRQGLVLTAPPQRVIGNPDCEIPGTVGGARCLGALVNLYPVPVNISDVVHQFLGMVQNAAQG